MTSMTNDRARLLLEVITPGLKIEVGWKIITGAHAGDVGTDKGVLYVEGAGATKVYYLQRKRNEFVPFFDPSITYTSIVVSRAQSQTAGRRLREIRLD